MTATARPAVNGTYVDVIDPRALPTEVWMPMAAEMSRTSAMGEWTPVEDAGDVSDRCGVIVERETARALGMVSAGPWDDVPGSALVSLWLEPSARGSIRSLEGAMWFCRDLLRTFTAGLFAEVLSTNRPMLDVLDRLGVRSAVRMRSARYVDGAWHDLELLPITMRHLDVALADWERYLEAQAPGTRPAGVP